MDHRQSRWLEKSETFKTFDCVAIELFNTRLRMSGIPRRPQEEIKDLVVL